MKKVELIGGARIGGTNATYPFATLTVDEDELELNASILGNLVFQTSDILSLEPHTVIPVIGQGVKINHRVANYEGRIIFWTFRNPRAVIQEIKETGFLNKLNPAEEHIVRRIVAKQIQGRVPVKKGFAIGVIIIWNILLLIGFLPLLGESKETAGVGYASWIAVGALFLMALSSLISRRFRQLILKDGRELKDINKFSILIIFITGVILMFFLGY